MHFADSHIHFCNITDTSCYPDLKDAPLLLSCVAEHSEWESQKAVDDSRIVKFYGIHPWYADQWNDEVETELRTILSEDPDAQIGEIGLDNKHPNLGLQKEVFSKQLSLASEFGRTVNIHNIGCDGDLVRHLKTNAKNCRSIILHSFNGPDTKPFRDLNCYFSINPRILGKSPEKLHSILSTIPEDRLLIETDAPYIARNFVTMGDFISTLAEILDIEPEVLAERTRENARRAVQ
ncbi:MAG: TatD family hydrolase [archaeon]|nr:TatD family hydrolase [archaeon]